MKIVITGPTGAIGHAIIEECIALNHEVLAVCRRNSARIGTIPVSPPVRIVEADLSDYAKGLEGNSPSKLKEVYGAFDVFIHLAWNGTVGSDRNDTELQKKNVMYSLDAVKLAYALGCKRFIFAGSQAEYGRVEGKLTAATPTDPENEYGKGKLLAGGATKVLAEQLGMEHIRTRVLSVYGPFDGEKSMIISSLRKLLSGEKASFTKGEQEWDYLFAKDAGKAFLALAEKGISGKTYVIGSGEAKKLADDITVMASKVKEMTGTDPEIGLGDIPYGEKQVMNLCADITDLTADTGWVPETGFEEGIKKTIQYVMTTMERQ